jgi:glycosyltransferase involved in cell wall biosynthesis
MLVEPASVSGLVQAITGLLDNASLANKLGEAGRERCHQMYSPDAHVEKLLPAFQAEV